MLAEKGKQHNPDHMEVITEPARAWRVLLPQSGAIGVHWGSAGFSFLSKKVGFLSALRWLVYSLGAWEVQGLLLHIYRGKCTRDFPLANSTARTSRTQEVESKKEIQGSTLATGWLCGSGVLLSQLW